MGKWVALVAVVVALVVLAGYSILWMPSMGLDPNALPVVTDR
jgi:hypothetical protein